MTTVSPFEARVIVARLGSDGIVWELRGSVDGPLAVGPVEVLVALDDYDLARELLLVDAVEDALTGSEPERSIDGGGGVWLVVALATMALFAIARMAAGV